MECIEKLCRRESKQAPVTTIPTANQNDSVDFMSVQNVLLKRTRLIHGAQDLLKPELYVLSREIYKHTGPFRREKILARMRQVNRILKHYETVAVHKKLDIMLDLITECRGTFEAKNMIYTPSFLVYAEVLLDILKAAKLLHRAVYFCFEVKIKTKEKLNLGHYIPNMLAIAALVSRMWICCRSLLISLIEVYSVVRSLQSKCFNELEKTNDLPMDLEILSPEENLTSENSVDVQQPVDLTLSGYKTMLFGIYQSGEDDMDNGFLTRLQESQFDTPVDGNSHLKDTHEVGKTSRKRYYDQHRNHAANMSDKESTPIATQPLSTEFDIGIVIDRSKVYNVKSTNKANLDLAKTLLIEKDDSDIELAKMTKEHDLCKFKKEVEVTMTAMPKLLNSVNSKHTHSQQTNANSQNVKSCVDGNDTDTYDISDVPKSKESIAKARRKLSKSPFRDGKKKRKKSKIQDILPLSKEDDKNAKEKKELTGYSSFRHQETREGIGSLNIDLKCKAFSGQIQPSQNSTNVTEMEKKKKKRKLKDGGDVAIVDRNIEKDLLRLKDDTSHDLLSKLRDKSHTNSDSFYKHKACTERTEGEPPMKKSKKCKLKKDMNNETLVKTPNECVSGLSKFDTLKMCEQSRSKIQDLESDSRQNKVKRKKSKKNRNKRKDAIN